MHNHIRPLCPILLTSLLALAFASSTALAQQGNPPPRIDVAAVTGADAKTAQAVDAILREHHDRMEALQRDLNARLAKLLTPVQLDKLHESMRKNRPSEGPQPSQNR